MFFSCENKTQQEKVEPIKFKNISLGQNIESFSDSLETIGYSVLLPEGRIKDPDEKHERHVMFTGMYEGYEVYVTAYYSELVENRVTKVIVDFKFDHPTPYDMQKALIKKYGKMNDREGWKTNSGTVKFICRGYEENIPDYIPDYMYIIFIYDELWKSYHEKDMELWEKQLEKKRKSEKKKLEDI